MGSFIGEINGVNVIWNKSGEGKPLLFLHGWGSSSASFSPILNRIQSFRTCYLPDLPGFGKSGKPKQPWTVSDYADAIEIFIQKQLPDGPFDLLVHSFGARIAIKLLIRPKLSSRIEKVIFTGAAGLVPKRSASYYFKKNTAKLLKLPFHILPATLRERGLMRLRKSALWKSLGSSDYQKLGGVMRQTFVNVVTEHLDEELPKISHEILLLWGRNDTATPLEQAKRMEAGLKNCALVTIANAGHYAFIDKPAQFAAIALAYLEPE
ncbi:MAG: alpha/beta hydrolase [Balneolaceae bacterium]|nr:MAG: alpha/beta hydrolase [Balneolaceae bacterium]